MPIDRLRCIALICLGGLLSATGCGDGRPSRFAVSGQVLIDGAPLTTGFIRVVPADARPAVGAIGADGRFTLMTYDGKDGCIPGTHPIAIVATRSVGSDTVEYLVPKHYQDHSTSGETVTIDKPRDDLTIELTWAGGKPFTERHETGGDIDPANP